MQKKIAVFIPCYNASRTIAETIVSVKASVARAYSEVPVYIYDDCSTDNSTTVAGETWGEAPGLIIRRNAVNQGERKTTNDAFNYFYGKYDWILIIHADDIVKPEWLPELYDQIEKAEEDRFFTVWSSFDALDNETKTVTGGDDTGLIRTWDRTDAEKKYFITKLYCSWHISGAAFNVGLYRQLNGFDTTMPQFGDTDFYARGLLAGYKDIYIARTLTVYRVIANSVSSTSVKTNRDIREGLYLLNKFNPVFDRLQLRAMCKSILQLSARRCFRWFLQLKMSNFLFCLKVTFNLSLKYLQTYGKVHS
ncbi:MAG TPA: glycosyltransferase family 2 protein [Puia sp.]|jgi:glycosyltransferase involved in cell wall biosynthesis|nr:glycosyltransferase family 2 protein [Puia sp.]